VFADPRVTLQLHSTVDTVDTAAGVARGVSYTRDGASESAQADLVVLAASALFNPHILLRSGINHALLGKRLSEQMPIDVTLDLAGVKCYNGSTLLSGLGYLFYEGEHRRDHAACMIETWNSPFAYWAGALRSESGRWNERLMLRFLFDDLPRDDNTVTVSPTDPRMAVTRFVDYSDYAKRGAAQVPRMIDKLATVLPIERVAYTEVGDHRRAHPGHRGDGQRPGHQHRRRLPGAPPVPQPAGARRQRLPDRQPRLPDADGVGAVAVGGRPPAQQLPHSELNTHET
jgi:hypothetical protein